MHYLGDLRRFWGLRGRTQIVYGSKRHRNKKNKNKAILVLRQPSVQAAIGAPPGRIPAVILLIGAASGMATDLLAIGGAESKN